MKDKKAVGVQHPQQTRDGASQTRNSLPWSSLEQQVVRMQKQIAEACQRGDRQAVHALQQRLMESEAARLLAVRRVTGENQGKDTAGVDGVKSLTPKERLEMASAIHPRNWNQQPARPVRRVWIPKPGTTELRPLAILSMIDRCKQALVKLALEPEWETQFEAHSYGFRPNRGVHDAIAAILVAIERHPTFVFDADIEAAFDYVNQAGVLEKLRTFPALKQAINAWLKAGVMDGTRYFPSETGIAQGGVLSPLLMNIALHGMEAVVTQGSDNSRSGGQPLLVRYADDFVILHSDLNELQQAVRRVKQWLAKMGLQVNADKTRIAHTLMPYQGQVGFDFLGFNIRQEPVEKSSRGKGGKWGEEDTRKAIGFLKVEEFPTRKGGKWGEEDTRKGPPRNFPSTPVPTVMGKGVKTIIAPSQEANERHFAAIDSRLQQLQRASQAEVIAELNPLIIGWVAYYNGIVPAATLSRYDDLLEQRLIDWASRRHSGKGRDWLLARYWQRAGNQRGVFATPDGVQLRTYRQTSILRG